jgi:glutamate 5-kinase
MIDLVRQEVMSMAHTIVVKIGTNVLTREDGQLNRERLQSLVDQVQRVRKTGRRVVIVSSGAVGSGLGKVGLKKRPSDLRHLQACAAIGQPFLMQAYEECMEKHSTHTAQILLTAGDFDNRVRYLNARNTILTLFEWNVLPIINENDTISVDEIRFGDNDHLAALVTNLIQAPLLILLSVVDGLHAADPTVNPSAQLLSTVSAIDSTIFGMAGDSQSMLGTGGMRTKIRAARLATAAGESVIMANGTKPGVLDSIVDAKSVGTLFLPQRESMPAWKRWLGYTARTKGRFIVDTGARDAVEKQNRSLLPIGVVQVIGNFNKGDVVSLCDKSELEFARGLVNYSSVDAARIIGIKTEDIAQVLGVVPYEELVHRDNLVVLH